MRSSNNLIVFFFFCSLVDRDLVESRERQKKLYVGETPWGLTRKQRKLVYAGRASELEDDAPPK
jgi:hypothetical protein